MQNVHQDTPPQPDQPERKLSGADKVTAILLAMGKDYADRVLREFDEPQIRTVAYAAAKLPAVPSDELAAAVGELAEKLNSEELVVGSQEKAQELVAGILPDERTLELMAQVRSDPGLIVWPKLSFMDSKKIATIIGDEHPQVSAYILSRLPPDAAAAALKELDPKLRIDLSSRMLATRPPSESAIKLVERRLLQKLSVLNSTDEMESAKRLSAILNRLDRDDVDAILQKLETAHPATVPKVRERLFRFEDFGRLPERDRTRVVEELQTEELTLALRDANDELGNVILSSLSARARRIVEQELALKIKVRRSEIDAMQRRIAKIVLDMAERGEIQFNDENDVE